jgi:hypothetical protein
MVNEVNKQLSSSCRRKGFVGGFSGACGFDLVKY